MTRSSGGCGNQPANAGALWIRLGLSAENSRIDDFEPWSAADRPPENTVGGALVAGARSDSCFLTGIPGR